MSERGTGLGAILDTRGEFFRPLWVRILVFAISAGWSAIEFSAGNSFWGVIAGGFAVIGGWGFFFDPQRAAARPKPNDAASK